MKKKTRRRLQQAKRYAKAWARWVASRVVTEPDYLDTVISVGLLITELFCRSRTLRRLAGVQRSPSSYCWRRSAAATTWTALRTPN